MRTYKRTKKACEYANLQSSTEEDVIQHISSFNDDPSVHGILVQLHHRYEDMNEERIRSAVCIEKDVDGFHPLNIGRLAIPGRYPLVVPCTPRACVELLERYRVEIKGKSSSTASPECLFSVSLFPCDPRAPRSKNVGGYCEEDLTAGDRLLELFQSGTEKDDRSYASEAERMKRLEVFKNKLKGIDDFNRRSSYSFWSGLHQFSELTQAEFKAICCGGTRRPRRLYI